MAKKPKNDRSSPEQVLLTLDRLARLLRSSSHDKGLHPAQWEALRYLASANQFSNSPRALAQYLGATKGTVSQTVTALVRKGLLEKSQRAGDTRSVVLQVKQSGHDLLMDDSRLAIQKSIAVLGDRTAKKFCKGLEQILAAEILRRNEPQFGTCMGCRFLRQGQANHCMKYEVLLQESELNQMCVSFVSVS